MLFLVSIISILVLTLKQSPIIQEYADSPFCGNNICERNEEIYCLDCNLSCKSELCNSKINVLCDNCSVESELIQELFDHQIIIYNCLSNYYGYNPSRLVYHTVKNADETGEVCNGDDGCYVGGGNFGEKEGIIQEQIPGLVNFGNFRVKNKEDVGFEVHELSHAFTYYGLGRIPSWLNEGIAIYSESKLSCDSEIREDEIIEIYELYNNQTITIPANEYERTKNSPHVVGSRYLGYLEDVYGCDKECVSKIIHSLYSYRQNHTKYDLRKQVITNKIIKEKSEEVIGRDLTKIFDILEIN